MKEDSSGTEFLWNKITRQNLGKVLINGAVSMGPSQHSRKACLQEFQNATFFEGTELTAWPFKRAKNQPFSLQRTRKVRTELQDHLL